MQRERETTARYKAWLEYPNAIFPSSCSEPRKEIQNLSIHVTVPASLEPDQLDQNS